MTDNRHLYDDIINLPHHQSEKHPHMSMYNRAAQFSPFAALAGYEEAVKETARLTDRKIELSDEQKDILNEKLMIAADTIGENVSFTFTYFVPDKKKSGGRYISHTGEIRRIDTVSGIISLTDRTDIEIEQIFDIQGDILKNL